MAACRLGASMTLTLALLPLENRSATCVVRMVRGPVRGPPPYQARRKKPGQPGLSACGQTRHAWQRPSVLDRPPAWFSQYQSHHQFDMLTLMCLSRHAEGSRGPTGER
jgi:hypothetical protein